MTNTIDQDRVEFENWAKTILRLDGIVWNGQFGYNIFEAKTAFEAWQASAQLQRERQAQPTPSQSVVKEQTSMQKYNEIMQEVGKNDTPIENLRFYLSLALKSQDWLDVETFINEISAQLSNPQAPQPQTVKDALEQAASLSDELNPPEYYTQVEREAYSIGIVHYWQAIRALIQTQKGE